MEQQHGLGRITLIVTTVAFWALVVFGIVALFRGTRDSRPRSPRRDADSAQHILDERFARGDIDAEEYHRRQQELHSTH